MIGLEMYTKCLCQPSQPSHDCYCCSPWRNNSDPVIQVDTVVSHPRVPVTVLVVSHILVG